METTSGDQYFSGVRRARTTNLAALTTIYNELETNMMSCENTEKVKKLYKQLCDRYEKFKLSHLSCLDACIEPDVYADLELSYGSCEQNFIEFRDRFSQWKADEKTPDETNTFSLISRVSSAGSSRSRLRTANTKRLKAEHKLRKQTEQQSLERARKELEIKQQLLDQTCEVEEAAIEESVWLQAVEEETGGSYLCDIRSTASNIPDLPAPVLTTETQHTPCVSTITDVHSKADNMNITPLHAVTMPATGDNSDPGSTRVADDMNIPAIPGVTTQLRVDRNTSATIRDVTSGIERDRYSACAQDITNIMPSSLECMQPRVSGNQVFDDRGKSVDTGCPTVAVPSIDAAFHRLATTLHEGFNLPKPELLTFNGAPTAYCKFIKNFETNIECRISDDRLRLSYLIQYCEGEAKYCIEDCVLLKPCAGYKRARDILYSRYGRPHVIVRSYVETLVYGPEIKASDINGLSKLALEMQKCEITLSQLGFSSDIDNSENLRRIVKRLPIHMRYRWVDVAHSINESGREPRFSDLSKFVDEKSRVASSMYGFDLARETSQFKSDNTMHSHKRPSNGFKSNATALTIHSESKSYERKCACCDGTCVDLESCNKFKSMNLDDRSRLVRKFKLCFNCLKGKHFSNNCRKSPACTACKRKHHILLHIWTKSESEHTATQSSVNCAATKGSTLKNCLGIIPVIVKGGNGRSCKTYALLDDGADKTLCDERLIQTLNVASKPITFHMSTVSSSESANYGQEVDLHVQALMGGDEVILPKVWSVSKLPISTRSAATSVNLRNLQYLADIDIPQIHVDDVMLLIGTDSPAAHIPLEVRAGNDNQPYAVRTRLGWTVRGPIPDITTSAASSANVHFGQSSNIVLQQQLERMWTTYFDDKIRVDNNSMSVEDKRAESKMESTISHEDGHYKLGLPWRDEGVSLPNNIMLAQTRLQQLKRKLSRDSTLRHMYTETVGDYIAKGYATEVGHIGNNSKRTWYLPHHPVVNVNKPGKVRVVFDCAAKYHGVSLNSQLLQGPDLMNSLVGVLIRFRQEKVAMCADIEAMFHQVRVREEDCDALRFLWWPNGDMDQQPRHYCMQVHLFGATSSPSCAAYALKQTAIDNAAEYEPEVVSTVKNNFYVDDCLKSVSSEEKAIKLASDLQSMMKKGGFRLTKWLSNNRTVINAIPESERASSVVNLSPGDVLPSERALGVKWNVNEDTIEFKVKLTDKPLTRRGILSIVSSMYDPLGLVAPVTLRAKAIVQSLCRQQLGWDDIIPEKNRDEWQQWLDSLPSLENVSVKRCFQSQGFGKIKNAQLDMFSDGSELGYGACAYLRLVDEQGNITCSLVMGKSRLAPIKQISIPRLELSGAVVACRVYSILAEELQIKIDTVTFWTDSTIVLGYIRNVSRRFKTFVGNRLSVIHDITSPDQWRYVDTLSNPADIASRGIGASETQRLNTWLNGPDFLWHDHNSWHEQTVHNVVVDDDVEIKKEISIHATTSDVIDNLMCRYSDWLKLRRVVAWLIRFKLYCKQRYLKQTVQCNVGKLTLAEMQTATNAILVHVQEKCFMKEKTNLKCTKPVNKDSRIASLNPVINNDLIRAKGRMNSTDTRECPIILPNGHHVTTLIIRFIHETHGHVGKQQVLAATREKYWIIKRPSSVKRIVKSCVLCIRQHSPFCWQQMAPLLEEQVTPDKPPFTFVGIDYFGPFTVKSGRTCAKRYGCLFTCLTTRAVHLEVAHRLTTDSFIAAFQRFASRRGYPSKVFSDNGTNLVSGDRELRKSIKEWNQSKIGQHMIHSEIEWHFNPPYASHRGGVWERMISSVRTILKALVREQTLTDEQLTTLMTEAEKIMNDRPITQVSSDPNDPPALTPSMMLLLK